MVVMLWWIGGAVDNCTLAMYREGVILGPFPPTIPSTVPPTFTPYNSFDLEIGCRPHSVLSKVYSRYGGTSVRAG
jgi:hypothetical protein